MIPHHGSIAHVDKGAVLSLLFLILFLSTIALKTVSGTPESRQNSSPVFQEGFLRDFDDDDDDDDGVDDECSQKMLFRRIFVESRCIAISRLGPPANTNTK